MMSAQAVNLILRNYSGADCPDSFNVELRHNTSKPSLEGLGSWEKDGMDSSYFPAFLPGLIGSWEEHGKQLGKRNQMSGIPYRSKLTPYESEILEMRKRRPPVPYKQIVSNLKDPYGVDTGINTVFASIRVRKRWDRVHSSDGQPAGSPRTSSSMSLKPVRPGKVEKTSIAIEGTPPDPVVKQPAPTRRRFMSSFTPSDRYNLHRLTPEEKAAYIKELEAQEEN